MRHNGKIIEWNDARGFGFAVIPGATERHFLHIKSIMGAGRRPRVGNLLSFEVDSASAKGPRAVRVRFANAPGRPAATAAPNVVDLFLDEESQSLAMLSDFIDKTISLHPEASYSQEQYDIVLL